MGSENQETQYYCRGARSEDVPELVEVTQSAFGTQRTGDFARSLEKRLETLEDNRIIVEKTSMGEKIIGSVPIFRYPLHFGPGITMQSGGLFMVAVRKEYQRRGFGQKVIADCNEYLKKQGCEINLLFTGSPDFYRHQGYEQGGGKPLFVLEKSNLVQLLNKDINQEESENAKIITRNLEEKDLPIIASIYEKFNQKYPLTRIRTLEYWRHNFKINPNRFSEHIRVFMIEELVVAYLWGHPSEEGFEVVEYAIQSNGTQDSYDLISKAVFRFLLAQIAMKSYGKINFHLFKSFPLVKMAIEEGARDSTGYWSALMVAILNQIGRASCRERV